LTKLQLGFAHYQATISIDEAFAILVTR